MTYSSETGKVIQVAHVETSPTQYSIASQNIAAIPELQISFTPKRADSKILLQAMINSNGVYVSTYGFLKDGVVMSPATPNNNSTGSVSTTYYGYPATSVEYMFNVYISFMEDAGSTTTRTYDAAACASWDGTIYTLFINDRNAADMRSISSLTIMEIAA